MALFSNKTAKSLIKYWLPLFAWCALIFYFSSIPDLKVSDGLLDLVLRKIAHMSEFFILSWLAFRTFRRYKGFVWALSAASALSLLYAISDEVHQYFIVTRNASFVDVLIDALGILLFAIWSKDLVNNHDKIKKSPREEIP